MYICKSIFAFLDFKKKKNAEKLKMNKSESLSLTVYNQSGFQFINYERYIYFGKRRRTLQLIPVVNMILR